LIVGFKPSGAVILMTNTAGLPNRTGSLRPAGWLDLSFMLWVRLAGSDETRAAWFWMRGGLNCIQTEPMRVLWAGKVLVNRRLFCYVSIRRQCRTFKIAGPVRAILVLVGYWRHD
jgi:hypothetical protein